MTPPPRNEEALLEVAYDELGFRQGSLLDATQTPSRAGSDDWLSKGEWLSLAHAVHAEKVFFVDDNPVVVFAKSDTPDPAALRKLVNSVWCMSRPRLLFLATPGELNVLDLAEPPVKQGESVFHQDRLRGTATTAAEVQTELQQFHREQIESGRLFEDERFETSTDRADAALIRDLRTLRKQLTDDKLGQEHAHALIGRSIFIRYLEDRRILTREYFESVANGRDDWLEILNARPRFDYADDWMGALLYPRVLSDKQFTYALFTKLAQEFNGDMFPSEPGQESAVTPGHLETLQSFLTGAVDQEHRLFFYAYSFDVIPIELISSIYEEFYKSEAGGEDDLGSHYTPPALVDYVLAQVLTPERLARNPRVLDPACGSGIFLVEAFRRIVRYRVQRGRKRLSQPQLRTILRDQIAGIDINPGAVRIAAFSLYLALLNYQEPPDIQRSKRLPNLILSARSPDPQDGQHLDILVAGNAFDIEGSLPARHGRRFSSECANVIVGNPPWGSPRGGDSMGVTALAAAQRWCSERGFAVGDKEQSQMFIHRSLDFLRPGGLAGLLVSTGALWKESDKSRSFRQQWLRRARLLNVTNFAHVRAVFFRAIAPFASVVFEKDDQWEDDHRFRYWSAKRTAMAERLGSVVLSRADLRLVSQRSVMTHDDAWKIYWWGGHRDEALIRSLQSYPAMGKLRVGDKPLCQSEGYGFEEGRRDKVKSDWLGDFKQLPSSAFRRYGRISASDLTPVPDMVYRRGARDIYRGVRLLFKRGMGRASFVARLETKPYCFTHSIYGIRVPDSLVDEAKIVLGICWSSLTIYYLWMTSGSWGSWHDAVHKRAVLDLPIRLPDDRQIRRRILKLVDDLSATDKQSPTFDRSQLEKTERALDEAIFDLYQLTESERDLVLDTCRVSLDLFYRHARSNAVKPVPDEPSMPELGLAGDLAS
ncbi:MAG TPA: N-6 DNA methylase, partial [Anaerolineae bacterium]|nr:N-6 DNA methylase [Anaerolineae bacterium]